MHAQARAVLVSGHLALLDVLPADLTKQLWKRWSYPDCGAAELRLHAAQPAYFPGFVDRAAEPDRLPPLRDFNPSSDVQVSLCKAAALKSVDDRRWWEPDAREEIKGMTSVTQAAKAAEYLLRIPGVRNHAISCAPVFDDA